MYKTGDILFLKGENWIGRIIEFFSRSQFSHVALILDNYHVIEAAFNGIRVNHIAEKSSDYEVYRTNLTEEQINKIITFTQETISTPYDYIELIRYLLWKYLKIKTPDNKYKYICSEFVYEIYKQLGFKMEECESCVVISPGDLYKSISKMFIKIQ